MADGEEFASPHAAASSESSQVEASQNAAETESNVPAEKPKKRKPGSPGLYQRIEMPTAESIAQEDFMNNCIVRTILSGVMGTGLGVVFGIFMGTMDTSVRHRNVKIIFSFSDYCHMHRICSILMAA